MLTSASTGAFLFGGNAMVRRTAGTAQTSPPPVRLGTAGLVSFSATTETAPVRTFCVMPTRTVTTDQMKTLCSVVGFLFIFWGFYVFLPASHVLMILKVHICILCSYTHVWVTPVAVCKQALHPWVVAVWWWGRLWRSVRWGPCTLLLQDLSPWTV